MDKKGAFMAKNPNESLPNRHAIFVAVSGAGKTQAMAQHESLKKKSSRVILWDTHRSFKADHYNTIPELLKALKKAVAKKGGYRIAYGGAKSARAFDDLCRIVSSISDGRIETPFVVDELASVASAIGKDTSPFGDLLRESRKFGVIVLCSATSAAEIPKTAFKNCLTKVIGAQGSTSDAKIMADYLLVDHKLLFDTELKPLNFWIKSPGKAAEKYAVKYKQPPL